MKNSSKFEIIELINPTTFKVQNQKLFIRSEVQAASSLQGLQVHPFSQDMKNILPTFNCTNKQAGIQDQGKEINSKGCQSHYSKNQIFVQKFNFDKTPTCSRVFHHKFF